MWRRAGRGPRGWRRPDADVLDELCERIVRAGVDASQVAIEVDEGQVWLTGPVESAPARAAIELLAAGVPGIRGVHADVALAPADDERVEPDPETVH
jgi:osmotically-inducible protein OsmY